MEVFLRLAGSIGKQPATVDAQLGLEQDKPCVPLTLLGSISSKVEVEAKFPGFDLEMSHDFREYPGLFGR